MYVKLRCVTAVLWTSDGAIEFRYFTQGVDWRARGKVKSMKERAANYHGTGQGWGGERNSLQSNLEVLSSSGGLVLVV